MENVRCTLISVRVLEKNQNRTNKTNKHSYPPAHKYYPGLGNILPDISLKWKRYNAV